jgi:hypothetical protein
LSPGPGQSAGLSEKHFKAGALRQGLRPPDLVCDGLLGGKSTHLCEGHRPCELSKVGLSSGVLRRLVESQTAQQPALSGCSWVPPVNWLLALRRVGEGTGAGGN